MKLVVTEDETAPLDAIRLASVMEFRKEIDWMLVYDKRLLEVANLNGIDVASPS